MAFLATRCNSRLLFDRLLTRSLISLNPERTVTVRSKQFPEYSLLYDFDKIKNASKVNKAKYMATVFYACASPVLITAQTFSGMIPPDYVGSFLFYGKSFHLKNLQFRLYKIPYPRRRPFFNLSTKIYNKRKHLGKLMFHIDCHLIFPGGFITVFLHSIGLLFNNAIGYIYIKDDNKSIKFSSVGYWGERVDVDTSIDKICAFGDEPSIINNPWYRKVRLADSKTIYKIYESVGEILDPKLFAYIFGGLAGVKKCDWTFYLCD